MEELINGEFKILKEISKKKIRELIQKHQKKLLF